MERLKQLAATETLLHCPKKKRHASDILLTYKFSTEIIVNGKSKNDDYWNRFSFGTLIHFVNYVVTFNHMHLIASKYIVKLLIKYYVYISIPGTSNNQMLQWKPTDLINASKCETDKAFESIWKQIIQIIHIYMCVM